MGYSIKWVTEHLGITRDMIRYYEKSGLLSKNEMQNPENGYRDYSEEDMQRIWAIKLLISIGFSAAEIRSFINDPAFDFEAAVAQKVEMLQAEYDAAKKKLDFAKTIKLTGCVPSVSKLGGIKFDEFLSYAYENWSAFDRLPTQAEPSKGEELTISFDEELLTQTLPLHGYCQVLADMKDLPYSDETVQRVVRLMLAYQKEIYALPGGEDTLQRLAKSQARFFSAGDVAKMFKQNYGEDGCRFIVRALECFGGFKTEDL